MKSNGTSRELRNPWLIAVWPGMGHVAATAGGYLLEALRPEPAGMIPSQGYFGIDHVEVNGGIARAAQLPRNMFFTWRDPEGNRDLMIFVGEAQPALRGYDLCRRIIDVAVKRGVQRVVTFAAMGTQLHPADQPGLFGAVTSPDLLKELHDSGVTPMTQGRLGGLNGTLLAAAAERGVSGMCLLGEMPFYAASVPNPKSSLAVLEALSGMMGIELDLTKLRGHAQKTEEHLLALLEQIKQQAGHLLEQDTEIFEGGLDDEPDEPREREPRHLDRMSRKRIEELFKAAEEDRSRVADLKQELDRLHAFREYEDRFLDLFKR